MDVEDSLSVKKPRLLNSAFKCTLCFRVAMPPILACLNEHIACGKCAASWKAHGTGCCGLCTTQFNIPCRLLEQIAETVDLSCEYGCGNRFLLSEYHAHTNQCELRPYECKYGCKSLVEFSNIVQHLTKVHRMYSIKSWWDGKFSVDESHRFVRNSSTGAEVEFSLFLTEYNGMKFLLEEELNDQGVLMFVRIIGKAQDALKYRAKISVTASNMVNKLSFVTIVNPLRESVKSIMDSGQFAKISSKKIIKWSASPEKNIQSFDITLKIRQMKPDLD